MKMYYIGVDGGGSKTCAILADDEHNILTTSYSGPANIRTDVEMAYASIQDSITKLCAHRDIKPIQIKLGVGVAGYSNVANRAILLDLLSEYAVVHLESDCHIACIAAHGQQNGAIIICGTGVVAYSIIDGKAQQISGWGFPHGDLGGGAWLGLEACKLVCKAIDGICDWSDLLSSIYARFNNTQSEFKSWLLQAAPKDFADISKLVIEKLSTDVNAADIYMRGLYEVRQLIQSLLSKMDSIPLQIGGGLAQIYFTDLKVEFSNLSLMKVDPAMGAIYLAARSCK